MTFLSAVLAFLALNLGSVSGTVTSADRYEAEVRISGQRLPFVVVFSTRFQIDGRATDAAEFWRRARAGDTVQIKARHGGVFWIARSVNLRRKS